ncbi:MAG TPA: response regulator [Acidobacteriota bacterium]
MSDRLDRAAIREIFFGEAEGYLRFFRSAASELAEHPDDQDLVEELLRQLHSLKGSAGTLGFARLAEAAAALEQTLEQRRPLGGPSLAVAGALLQDAAAVFERHLAAERSGGPDPSDRELDRWVERCRALLPQADRALEQSSAAAPPDSAPEQSSGAAPLMSRPVPAAGSAPAGAPGPPPGGALSGALLADLKEAFVLEALEHVEELERGLLRLEGRAGEETILRPLMRTAHTLKGSAATVSYTELGELAHRIEDVLETAVEYAHPLEDRELHLLFQALDGIKSLIEDVRRDRRDPRGVLAELEPYFAAVIQRIQQPEGGSADSVPALEGAELPSRVPFAADLDLAKLPSVAAPRELLEVTRELEEELEPLRIAAGAAPGAEHSESAGGGTAAAEPHYLKVSAARLDRVMNLVGELIINRNRLARRLDELAALNDELSFSKSRLLSIIQDFRDRYEFTRGLFDPRGGAHPLAEFKELEFDKYDEFNLVSRNLVEIASDIAEIMKQTGGFFASFNLETDQISRVTGKLQEEISTIRHLPLGRLFQRFRRLVHDACYSYGKQVELELLGTDTELDRTIAEEIAEPLIHLLRNAVYHGIERPSQRLQLGKPAAGVVKLRAYQAGSRVVIEVSDDGAGIDLEAVRRRAVELGQLDPQRELSAAETLELIFQHGFTMVREADVTAGRGVGLDAVRASVQRLQGEIRISTEPGRGTQFTLTVPLSLAISQILTVQAGPRLFGLPVNVIQEVVQIGRDAVTETEAGATVRLRDQPVPLLSLAGVMGLEPHSGSGSTLTVLALAASDRRVALAVDGILGREETVIKTFGGFLRRFRLLSGASISGEGRIILILDVAGLAELGPRLQSAVQWKAAPIAPARPIRGPRLLLVDDSISIRKFVGALLTQAGFEVELASDGLEAFQKVTAARFDLIITDLEMPVMHGYELIAELKRRAELRSIPIVILTSRAGEKHRLKALEMGAQDYVVKPFNEEDLIRSVRRHLERAARPAGAP